MTFQSLGIYEADMVHPITNALVDKDELAFLERQYQGNQAQMKLQKEVGIEIESKSTMRSIAEPGSSVVI